MVIVYILAGIFVLWLCYRTWVFWQFHKTMDEAGLTSPEKYAVMTIYPTYAKLTGRGGGPQVLTEISVGVRSCRGMLPAGWYENVTNRRIAPTDALDLVILLSMEDPINKQLSDAFYR